MNTVRRTNTVRVARVITCYYW